jgi:CBS domain containing-hemolysin-like protein
MSGLTVGLLGIDELDLELKLSSGTPEEKVSARKVLTVVNKHHLLLVTLLLANALAMESLPLFLDEMFNTEISLAISVTFVLFFGEVIPQALCTGKDQLKIATRMVPLVNCLMVLFMPISYPIAKLLDHIMDHKESSVKMKSDDLKSFLSLHESFAKDFHDDEGLDRFQISLMHGVIDMNQAKVKHLMSPFKKFIRIQKDEAVKKEVLDEIINSPFQSIIVYDKYKSDVIGTVRVSEMFKIWEGEKVEGSDILIQEPVLVNSKQTVLAALKQMEAAQVALCFAYVENEGKRKVLGVLTRDVVLERVLRNNALSEREEIANISHALVGSVEKPKTHKKPVTPLRENLIG